MPMKTTVETLPHFLIIGAQKSASSLLHRCLEEHPDVFMPSEEIPFFEDPDFDGRSRRDLERVFTRARPGQTLGIKRPDYLGKPECAERIRDWIPKARLVAVLRDPVARAVSAYFHQMRFGFVPAVELNEGFRNLLSGAYAKMYPRSTEIIDFGYYHRHLRRFLDLFPQEQLLVFLHEDVQSDAGDTIEKTFAFVGVDTGYRPRALESRPMTGIYSIPRARLQAFMYNITSEFNADRTRIYPRRSPLRTSVLGFDRLVLARIMRGRSPALAPDIRRELNSIYAEDVAALAQLLRRDLSPWLRQSSTEG
jgi:hypothetical protein